MSNQLLKDRKNTPFKFEIGEIKFQERPSVLDAVYRISWRIPFTIFLIHRLAGVHSVSMRRLSLFNWLLQSSDRFEILHQAIVEGNAFAASSTKHDPGLVRTILYLCSIGYIKSKNNKYKLTSLGKKAAAEIENVADLFLSEKNILNQFSKTTISEARVNSIWGKG